MSDSSDAKDKLLREIVERELAMFLTAPDETGIEGMRQSPEAMRLMRSMTHSAHDNAFLKSYLEDLRKAEESGRNFMLEQYARMNNRIPPLSVNPLLDEVADAEMAFQNEASDLYPEIIRHKGTDEFRHYLRSGLESLSDESLQHYAEEMRKARREGRNPVLERHNWLARKMGRDELQSQ